MQIGNSQLDEMCRTVIVPAAAACGLEARRVDKHNQGGLLKSEIIRFIEESEIIIADLTNERPNCYLEVGYAMGVDKFRNLILTAREDHNADSPNHKVGGSKIHFDLSGYDVLFWHPDDLQGFREELEKRIRRRQAIIEPSTQESQVPFDETWYQHHRTVASEGLKGAGFLGAMEIRFSLLEKEIKRSPAELLRAADAAQIHTFGWPIGVVLNNNDKCRPHPTVDGIVAEIVPDTSSYDYWAIRKNGDFFLLKSLFEDERDKEAIFVDTRIIRTTEVLMYCGRLYGNLGVTPDRSVAIAVAYSGLRGRVVKSAKPGVWLRRTSAEERIEMRFTTTLQKIESDLISLVEALTADMFQLFDFFKPTPTQYSTLVNNFVNGMII